MSVNTPGHYAWMLREDIEHSVAPPGLKLAVNYEAAEDVDDRRLCSILAGQWYGGLEECLRAFLCETTRDLLTENKVLYPARLHFVGIPQLPDIELQTKWRRSPRRRPHLQDADTLPLMGLEVNTSLPAAAAARLALQRLSVLSLPPMPFDEQTHQWLPFDSATYAATTARYIADATRDVGWYGRGLLGEHINSFYLLARRIRFERFLFSLRDELLSAMNKWLSNLPSFLRLPNRLLVSGFPDPASLDRLAASLRSGSSSFPELLAKLK
jgi:hypothetical protein